MLHILPFYQNTPHSHYSEREHDNPEKDDFTPTQGLFHQLESPWKTHMEITVHTKIAALLNHFPELEESLIAMSPAFRKLKNPLLRRTVAKMATLQQAAKVGDLDLETLLNTLRCSVGQSPLKLAPTCVSATDLEAFKKLPVFCIFDARPILEAGKVPLDQILTEIQPLPSGQSFRLVTPFEPVPIKDLLGKRGYLSASESISETCVHTWFVKKG